MNREIEFLAIRLLQHLLILPSLSWPRSIPRASTKLFSQGGLLSYLKISSAQKYVFFEFLGETYNFAQALVSCQNERI